MALDKSKLLKLERAIDAGREEPSFFELIGIRNGTVDAAEADPYCDLAGMMAGVDSLSPDRYGVFETLIGRGEPAGGRNGGRVAGVEAEGRAGGGR